MIKRHTQKVLVGAMTLAILSTGSVTMAADQAEGNPGVNRTVDVLRTILGTPQQTYQQETQTTNQQPVTNQPQMSYEALQAENQALKQGLEAIRNMNLKGTTRDIHMLKMKEDELTRDIQHLEQKKQAIQQRRQFLETQQKNLSQTSVF